MEGAQGQAPCGLVPTSHCLTSFPRRDFGFSARRSVMLETSAISPRYAVVLGAACGFFLVGTLLAVVVLLGDYGADGRETPGKSARSKKSALSEEEREKLRKKLDKYDRLLGDLEERLITVSNELNTAREARGAAPGGAMPGGETGGTSSTVAGGVGTFVATRNDYSGAGGAPEIPMSDPAVVAALESLGIDAGREQEWREAVQAVYREVKGDEYRELRNRRVDRSADFLEAHLRLTQTQKEALIQIRRRENDKMAELYSRMTAENNREIQAEGERVQMASAEEFRQLLSPDQARRLGPTLNSLR